MPAQSVKPVASVSLDLDNQWSYMKIHGHPHWDRLPSYLPLFIPLILNILDSMKLKITIFVVGQDAAQDQNRDVLREIVKRGHEIGNHSFYHEPWFGANCREKVEKEILAADRTIANVTGQKPVGFRGPGFCWNESLLEILAANGYIYDASTLPTYLGPMARQYYFWTARLSSQEKKQRQGLFGHFRDGQRPLKPYHWRLPSEKTLLEIPVSTIPVLKLPFHLSYLIYLRQYSEIAMMSYLNLAILLCKLTHTSPSFLLHPLDLLGPEQVPPLSFFPGMTLNSRAKERVFRKVIETLARHFQLVKMDTVANLALCRNKLRVARPK